MKCPVCKKEDLNDWNNNLLGCEECGSTFRLEYFGYSEEGLNETIEDGFEPKEFLDKYGENIRKFKNGG